MIWEYAAAARPSAPGVHIFSVYGPQTHHGGSVPNGEDALVLSSTNTAATTIVGIPRHVNLYQPGLASTLDVSAGPRGTDFGANIFHNCCQTLENDGQATRSTPNPSMYLLDSGLWTACKASRWAMRERFRCDHFEHLLLNNSTPSPQDVVDMPVTGYFIPGSGKAINSAAGIDNGITSGNHSSIYRPVTAKCGDEEEEAVTPRRNSNNRPVGLKPDPRFVTVFPQRDLFLFGMGFGDDTLGKWGRESSILTLNPARGERSWGHSSGFRNLAYIWPPNLNHNFNSGPGGSTLSDVQPTQISNGLLRHGPCLLDNFLSLFDGLEGRRDELPRKFWVIDHGIRPKQLMPDDMARYESAMRNEGKEEDMQVVFYATDRKYTAVEFSDRDVDLPIPWETGFVDNDNGCIKWVHMMRQYTQFFEDQVAQHERDHGVVPDTRCANIGILACELL